MSRAKGSALTEHDLIDMARANADMAIDQREAYADSIASYARNVTDTLTEWKQSGKRDRILSVYFARVAELLA